MSKTKVISSTIMEQDLRSIAQSLGISAFISRSWKTRRGLNGLNFTLGLGPSKTYQRIGFSGRKVWAVCYHGHRDFMNMLFAKDQNAVLSSAMAVYEGLEDFQAKYRSVGDRNIGSIMNPLIYEEACTC